MTLYPTLVNTIIRLVTGRDHNAILISRWDAMSVAYEEEHRQAAQMIEAALEAWYQEELAAEERSHQAIIDLEATLNWDDEDERLYEEWLAEKQLA